MLYERLVARDSSDFAAWFGIGECTRDNQLVVPDPSSPSGWRFQSSYHRAVQAYSRALRTIPSSHLAFRGAGFARLNDLLRTDEANLRTGFRRDGEAVRGFAAYPSLEGDTLAFVPWPMEDVAAVRPGTVPASRSAASQHNRRELRAITLEWARAFPQSADAHEGLAMALEALGELRDVVDGQPSAFGELARARALATQPEQRLRLALVQARLWLRVEDFRRARMAADSVLQQWRTPGALDAERLAPLAMLTGRVEQARALMRTAVPDTRFNTPHGEDVAVPNPVALAAADALVLAGLGLVLPGLLVPTFSRVFVDDVLVKGMAEWVRPLAWFMAATALAMTTAIPAPPRSTSPATSGRARSTWFGPSARSQIAIALRNAAIASAKGSAGVEGRQWRGIAAL